jgi:ubiquinone/menaquinone biosynthesis C-methylase UbiE
MEQYLDRITEAYHGKLGPELAQKTRDRVHWIIKNAHGRNVLDVGCSQGLVSILLAREGKVVTGIDIAKESIDFANETLLEEHENTKEFVKFIQGNFLYEKLPEKHFDTIIITEVLEHFVSSKEVLNKAKSLLKDNGRIIVTVPFGINDFPDHKRTLYLMEIYQEMFPDFKVEKVEFMGKWIGFIGIKGENNIEIFPESLFVETEHAFFSIERELTDKNNSLKDQLVNYKSKLEELKKKEKILLSNVTEHKEKNEFLKKSIEKLEESLKEQQLSNENLKNEYKEKVEKQQAIIEELKQQLNECKTIIKGLQSDNNRQQEKIITIIRSFSEEKEKHEEFSNKLKASNKKLMNQLEEKNLQLTEFHNLKQESREKINNLQQKNLQCLKKIEENDNKIQLLESKNYSLSGEIKQLQIDKKETKLNFQNELEKKKQQLDSEIQNSKLIIDELTFKVKDLEKAITINSNNYQIDKDKFEAIIQEKLSNIKDLQSENLIMKSNNQMNEKEYKRELILMKENFSEILEELETTTKKLIKEIKDKENLQHKYNSLKNSKLGKVTMKYWALRSRS